MTAPPPEPPKLERIRVERGLSLDQVAEELDIKPLVLALVEYGFEVLDLKRALRLARRYETTVEELFGDLVGTRN